MNLHAIISGAISTINPPFIGTLRQPTGYTTAADGTQVPAYRDTPGVSVQVQALTARQTEHLDSLNITGILRRAWINANVQATNRSTKKGGDLVLIPTGMSVVTYGPQCCPPNDTWLVVAVDERWDADGWSSVTLQLQKPTP